MTLVVAGAQLWLVARAGTDIPFGDQWGVEGRWLYPAWGAGTLRFTDLLRAHNEHRILWTHLLNLGLYAINGQWDPLVSMVAVVGLRAACAGGLAAALISGWGRTGRWLLAAGVTCAFLPLLAWHSVLWGFESPVYFCLGLSLLALGWLGREPMSAGRWAAGLAAGVAAQCGMGAGALVPVALVGLVATTRAVPQRPPPARRALVAAAVLLFALAAGLHVSVPAEAELRAASVPQFLSVAGRCLAWPYPGNPWVALAVNLPLGITVWLRLAGRRTPRPGENLALALGFFAVAVCLAEAWVRGGGPELATGIPSRYADFHVILPIANAWCLAAILPEVGSRWRQLAWLAASAWGVVLVLGWLALSAAMWRGVIRPRMADREAPVRLVQTFQVSGDGRVFEGQPRLYVPSPDLTLVRQVLADPRMSGKLPPSLQAGRPLGPLSTLVRWLLRAATAEFWGALGLALLLAGWDGWSSRIIRAGARANTCLAEADRPGFIP